jgi:hypothetical protein
MTIVDGAACGTDITPERIEREVKETHSTVPDYDTSEEKVA